MPCLCFLGQLTVGSQFRDKFREEKESNRHVYACFNPLSNHSRVNAKSDILQLRITASPGARPWPVKSTACWPKTTSGELVRSLIERVSLWRLLTVCNVEKEACIGS